MAGEDFIRAFLLRVHSPAVLAMQVDLEGRALAGFAVYLKKPFVLLHDAVHHGQPQAGAPAHALCGEKGFKEMVLDLLVHAAAAVTDGQQHEVAGAKTLMAGAIGFVKGHPVGFNGDLADVCDGVSGVHAQVGQYLVELTGIHHDRPQACSRQPGQIDIFPDEMAQHLEDPLNGVVQID